MVLSKDFGVVEELSGPIEGESKEVVELVIVQMVLVLNEENGVPNA